MLNVLDASGTDEHLHQVVWQNLKPLLPKHSQAFNELVKARGVKRSPGLNAILPLTVEWLLAGRSS
ncbi:MAG: hypothetical protein QM811_14475 [Pirellulales bacterium]